MDSKTAVAGILIVLVALGGIAIAAPAVGNATSWMWTGHHEQGFGANSTGRMNGPAWNASHPDEAVIAGFRNAILNGDFQTAKNFSDTYNLGGPLFERLNQTTFATYSKIVVLENQLAQELGMNQTFPGRFMGGIGRAGFGRGMMRAPPHGNESFVAPGNCTGSGFGQRVPGHRAGQ